VIKLIWRFAYENCTSFSRKLITSLEKRKLIRLLIWTRKVYEEQGILIPQERTMNTYKTDVYSREHAISIFRYTCNKVSSSLNVLLTKLNEKEETIETHRFL